MQKLSFLLNFLFGKFIKILSYNRANYYFKVAAD